MNPAVTKVIFVVESFESAQVQVTESHFRCIDADHAAVTIDRVFAAPNLEAVQMLIVLCVSECACSIATATS